MVIKIREEDMLGTSHEARVQTVEDRALSASVMFNSGKKKKNSQEGDDFTGKSVLFMDGRAGVIVAQRPPLAFVLCDFNQQDVIGHETAILNTRTRIQVSESLIGKAIDCFGQVVEIQSDGSVIDSLLVKKESMEPFTHREIFAPIPQVKDIALINSPFLTGTAMIDALAPIGRGQNMLIIGENGLGQRDIIAGALKTQIDEMNRKITQGITCIYALTTLDNKERASVIKSLQQAGVLDHIILVTTRDHQHVASSQKGATASYAEVLTVGATGT